MRSEREDLDEMLGNLLDNACKWARSTVAVSSTSTGGDVVITVDDDGPGLEASMREAVLQRGVRADEAAPGSGLGLAIVRDLAELYGGSIALTSSRPGGLRARLGAGPPLQGSARAEREGRALDCVVTRADWSEEKERFIVSCNYSKKSIAAANGAGGANSTSKITTRFSDHPVASAANSVVRSSRLARVPAPIPPDRA